MVSVASTRCCLAQTTSQITACMTLLLQNKYKKNGRQKIELLNRIKSWICCGPMGNHGKGDPDITELS